MPVNSINHTGDMGPTTPNPSLTGGPSTPLTPLAVPFLAPAGHEGTEGRGGELHPHVTPEVNVCPPANTLSSPPSLSSITSDSLWGSISKII